MKHRGLEKLYNIVYDDKEIPFDAFLRHSRDALRAISDIPFRYAIKDVYYSDGLLSERVAGIADTEFKSKFEIAKEEMRKFYTECYSEAEDITMNSKLIYLYGKVTMYLGKHTVKEFIELVNTGKIEKSYMCDGIMNKIHEKFPDIEFKDTDYIRPKFPANLYKDTFTGNWEKDRATAEKNYDKFLNFLYGDDADFIWSNDDFVKFIELYYKANYSMDKTARVLKTSKSKCSLYRGIIIGYIQGKIDYGKDDVNEVL